MAISAPATYSSAMRPDSAARSVLCDLEMQPDTRLLFAYGTLMLGAGGKLGRAQRDRLAREARSLGAASTPGRLYDLGRYPGLVPPQAAGDIAHGECLDLVDAGRSLAWLDAYEGIVPGRHPHNPYERRQCPVTLADGRIVTAWVYVYLLDVGGARPIADGRWVAAAG